LVAKLKPPYADELYFMHGHELDTVLGTVGTMKQMGCFTG
jgi:hypothetical protein